jgi:hypothetical protein
MRQAFQQAAYGDLVFRAELEGARHISLADAAVGGGDEFTDVIAGRERGRGGPLGAFGAFFRGAGHAWESMWTGVYMRVARRDTVIFSLP